MKTLELNQMETLNGGTACSDNGAGFAVGAALGGAAIGGPVGFLVGATFGLLGGMFISIAGSTDSEGKCSLI